jgi:coenzyme F420-0:L-glutamate ligase / coenzyme F420-1:gamma-L-glutamate ligase
MAVVDELAAAGELVKGKCDQVPVAVVRGYMSRPTSADGPGAVALVRDAASDLFSLGTAEARAAGLREAATLPPATDTEAPDPAAVERAIAAVAGVVAPGTVFTYVPGEGVRATPPAGASDPSALVLFGTDVHRLRAALAAEGLPTLVIQTSP